jgi:hypothetical protein
MKPTLISGPWRAWPVVFAVLVAFVMAGVTMNAAAQDDDDPIIEDDELLAGSSMNSRVARRPPGRKRTRDRASPS